MLRFALALPAVSAASLAMALAASPVQAQAAGPQSVPAVDEAAADGAAGDEEATGSNEIVVNATRIAGLVDSPQSPILTLGAEDIASYGASSLSDLIAALGPQTGSGRGRGGGQPVILFNGQRIANFREMRNIPPEAVRRMEVLPEEVALRYGYAADQRVINFVLRDNFASKSLDAEYNAPSRGGFAETEFEGSLLAIGKGSRLNLNIKANDTSRLTEAERGVIQQPDVPPGVAGDPDPARFRSLVADSRDLAITGSWSRSLGEGGREGSLSASASITRGDSRTLSGLNRVVLTAPDGSSATRTYGDPLDRVSRTVTIAGGAALNKPLGDWQLSATLDATTAQSDSRIARRTNSAGLVAAAAAGTLAIDGALPALPAPGFDFAASRANALTSLVTVMGQPFRLPAGEASLTVKGGYGHTGIVSRDTRSGAARTRLGRNDLTTGLNLGIPLTSRREGVLAGVGDMTLNLGAGVNHLSDFGTLKDWSTGLTWSPVEKLGLQASYLVNEAAPSLGDLGNPLVQGFNVPVYDFSRGETVQVTVTSGGNPALRREKQRDLKLSASWDVPVLDRSSLLVEYFRNRSNNVTASFPVLTPAIEAAFPGRVQRDASGRLVALDRRPVTFAETRSERLRWGINLSGALGKPDPAATGRGGGERGAGTGASGPPRAGAAPIGSASGGARMGGPMARFMGGGNGQGRWNLSVFHTWRLSETVRIAPGGPVLDLLRGDALAGGGVARHALEAEGGGFYRGFGLRMNAAWSAPTEVRASGLPGTSDLRFGSRFVLNLRTFVDFDRQARVIRALPALKGSRLAFVFDNVFDSRQKVTDASGAVPLSYQKDYLDPKGRFIGVDFRKVF